MSFVPLAHVRRHVVLAEPLPFDVLDAQQRLLLARGFQMRDQAQMDALIQRGALVSLHAVQALQTADARTPEPVLAREGGLDLDREAILALPRAALPGLWKECLAGVATALQTAPGAGLRDALEQCSAPVLALVERDPDLAIFQVLARAGGADADYGARRSLQSAIACSLVAQRLHWSPSETEKAFKVGLSCNLSMLVLQGELSHQSSPPTPEQRHELNTHPMRSVQLLQQAGVRDPEWLQAVLDHHESEDGTGYPSGRRDPGDLASLARRADIYTAKLSARSTRVAMAADLAGRAMFMADPGHPMTAALVKEFGIYPPGCMVRMANGAVGVVVERGDSISSPIIALLTNGSGKVLTVPQRVSSSSPGFNIVAIVGEGGSQATATRLDRLASMVFA
ncbi:MAG: HD-GYP domain-containing protein [Rubrivivax sp.]|jgi:HD-GYP domain-containing protein (c-di-GMP phosphodiesterase class II)|nr:hypothetical protein [Rubrivivax sp.]